MFKAPLSEISRLKVKVKLSQSYLHYKTTHNVLKSAIRSKHNKY